MTSYSDLILDTICPFTNHCADIQVTERDYAQCLHITLRVHRADHSKVIGAGGKMVKALTLLFVKAGQRNKQPIAFEVLEPLVGEREPEPPFVRSTKWGKEKDEELASLIKPIVEGVRGKCTFDVTSDKRSSHVSFNEAINAEVLGALSTVIRAIGKSMGREVLVNAEVSV